MHDVPENLLYSKDHEWIEIDGDIGTIGISDHAQAELSDVVFVDLPEVGATVAAGRPRRRRGICQSRQRRVHPRFRRNPGSE